MTTAAPLMCNPEKREHLRVPFTREVRVFAAGRSFGQFSTKNLSLGGLFLDGPLDVPVGGDCRLELHETGVRSSLILNFCGKILRNEKSGVGIRFTAMEEDSFMFLQTMVLYSADDPIEAAERFLDGFTPTAASMC